MSHDLDVVLRRRPPAEAFAQFADGRKDLIWQGELGSEDNLVVSPAAEPSRASFLVYDGPVDEDAARVYGSLLPGLTHTLLLAVPFGRSAEEHDLAFSFGAWLADEYDGIVYEPQLDYIWWPASRRGERAQPTDDPDLV
jgi:hypothetical protein